MIYLNYLLFTTMIIYSGFLLWVIVGNSFTSKQIIVSESPSVSVLVAIRDGAKSLPNLILDLSKQNTEPLLNQIRSEIKDWDVHYSKYNNSKSWTAVSLKGFGGKEEFIIKPTEMNGTWRKNNEDKIYSNRECIRYVSISFKKLY